MSASPYLWNLVSGARAPSTPTPFSALQMESVKQGVDQRLGEGQEKLHQMWLSWNQKTPQDAEKNPAKPEVLAGAQGSLCLQALLYAYWASCHGVTAESRLYTIDSDLFWIFFSFSLGFSWQALTK